MTDDAPARPGDTYNRTIDWPALLEPAGWSRVYERNGTTYWRRPGKDQGVSATTNALGTDRLKVFTTSTTFDDQTTYDRFGAYAVLHHHGDLAAAASTLRGDGYGDPRPAVDPVAWIRDGQPTPVGPTLPPLDANFFVDWPHFWDQDHDDEEWLYPPILARGRAHAIYATHKVGKSLLFLEMAARLATGPDPVRVVYLDYEMTEGDVYERLDAMGYYGRDLDRFRYAFVRGLQPLDTPEGAAELLRILDAEQEAHPDQHLLLCLDTTSRAVAGEENSADTIRAFYRWTGLALKRRGITWARLDHAGKNADQGQRGSSAKGDDVDVVWNLRVAEGGLELVRKAARPGWVPPRVFLKRTEDPLRFTPETEPGGTIPDGTMRVVQLLDHLAVPVDWGRPQVREAIVASGHTPGRNQVLQAAILWRRAHTETVPLAVPESGDSTSGSDGDNRGDSQRDPNELNGDSGRGQSGTAIESVGTTVPYKVGDSVPDQPPETYRGLL